MKKPLLILFIAIVFISGYMILSSIFHLDFKFNLKFTQPSPSPAAPANDWLCIPMQRVGPITPNTTLENLKRLFGAENIISEKILVAEGTEEITATYIYKGTPDELELWWRENALFQKPLRAIINNTGGRWHTTEGITIGTTLAELNRINGASFEFFGFDWDYGGIVGDWNSGALDDPKGLTVFLTHNDNLPRRYIGDGVNVSSDDPGLAPFGVRVAQMSILLSFPAEE